MSDSSNSGSNTARKSGRTFIYVLVAGILVAIAVIFVLRSNAMGRPNHALNRDRTPATSAPKQ